MKNIFTCFLLLGITYCCYAQDYVPMVVEGACWEIRVSDDITIPPPDDYFFRISITEDTLIGDLLYHAVDNGYSGFLREDSTEQKVYFFRGEAQGGPLVPQCDSLDVYETLLYDFSAEIGDTVYICYDSAYFYVVTDISEETYTYNVPEGYHYDFDAARVFRVDAHFAAYTGNLDIKEGIGAGFGPFIPFINLSGYEGYFEKYYRRDCSINVTVMDFKEIDVVCIPNPASNTLSIRGSQYFNLKNVDIYNVAGQVERKEIFLDRDYLIDLTNLKNGLYFIIGFNENDERIFRKKIIKME